MLVLWQLKELASQRGARVEDGAVEPDKPLAEVLKENKDKKEEQFQAVWRSMKTGAWHKGSMCMAPASHRGSPLHAGLRPSLTWANGLGK